MMHWRKDWYSLMGPLMTWVAFIIAIPFLGAGAIVSMAILPAIGDTIVKTVGLFCALVLGPLAAFTEIAPPFVTREEVAWRNRNREMLFEGDVAWEDVPFLPPVLNRIRSTTGKRKREEEKEGAAASDAKPSIA
ncbi:hypothetical protein G6L94_33440 [Agrobacterium rhizogenes]|uniref:Uncharacterized protein n=10 Tax=Rhizobium/Agrobacterium group TaxID=227290 RepID=A0A2Z2PRQ4_RHIRH|nr:MULTISPECIES: hypothetical protein [Rhizobium/Agrobacterium group]AYD05035.1 hypothetical protein NCHU2750_56680 [Neorhizobium sp. NCHU2750]KJF70813.1 hypothetical protein RP75_24570 [Agrobacterium arsenijevicii]OCJ08437.1 hypothetical protein A6U88_25410 [Agrobacterium sp. B131/95]OCJ27223.1 hypothetical protein A6U89_30040 [Agrobacterium sp. B133/95]ASK43654.1 hypothetical protein [Agrobacterium radiobacter]